MSPEAESLNAQLDRIMVEALADMHASMSWEPANEPKSEELVVEIVQTIISELGISEEMVRTVVTSTPTFDEEEDILNAARALSTLLEVSRG